MDTEIITETTETEITETEITEPGTAPTDTTAAVSSSSPIEGRDFEDLWSDEVPTLIDFWAAWCGPCRVIAPVVSAMAAEYESRLRVVKVNVDEYPALSNEFGVMSIPTLVLTKNDAEVARVVGAVSRAALDQMVAPHL